MKKKTPLTFEEKVASLGPLPKPPKPPDDLHETAKACWLNLTSAMPDWKPRDLPTLAMACRWHAQFLLAQQRAAEATEQGPRWAALTEAAMCSKQFTALLRLLGLAIRGRRKPSKLERIKEMED